MNSTFIMGLVIGFFVGGFVVFVVSYFILSFKMHAPGPPNIKPECIPRIPDVAVCGDSTHIMFNEVKTTDGGGTLKEAIVKLIGEGKIARCKEDECEEIAEYAFYKEHMSLFVQDLRNDDDNEWPIEIDSLEG